MAVCAHISTARRGGEMGLAEGGGDLEYRTGSKPKGLLTRRAWVAEVARDRKGFQAGVYWNVEPVRNIGGFQTQSLIGIPFPIVWGGGIYVRTSVTHRRGLNRSTKTGKRLLYTLVGVG